MRCLLTACLATAFICGCGDDPYAHVEYDADREPPALSADDKTIEAPDWDEGRGVAGKLPGAVQARQIKKDSQVVIQGSFRVDSRDSRAPPPRVNVHMRRIEPGKKPVICASGSATATRQQGGLKYKVQLQAPPDAGHYDFEVRLRPRIEGQQLRFVVAEADIE